MDKWRWLKFNNPARTDGFKLSHWAKINDKDDEYPFAKINFKVEVIPYTDQDYEEYLKDLNPGWNRVDTDKLWELCQQFDLRFIIISDRWEQPIERTVEELKNRYYSCSKVLLENKGKTDHPIIKRPYNYEYEMRRKHNLEKLFVRTKSQHENEKKIVEDLKKLDMKIKKLERDEKSLAKLIGEGGNPMNALREAEEQGDKAEKKERVVGPFLRSSKVMATLPLSNSVIKKIDIVLQELGILEENLVCTEKVVNKFDILRRDIVKMLCIERHTRSFEKDIQDFKEKQKDIQEISSIIGPHVETVPSRMIG